jgi:hypothetical protein
LGFIAYYQEGATGVFGYVSQYLDDLAELLATASVNLALSSWTRVLDTGTKGSRP